MNINRHNYEEFFLLFADDELGVAEKEAVLQFAKQHPDLGEELEMIMDCRLDVGDTPVFPKEKLLKPAIWDLDEPDEVRSQMLSLLDNELSTNDKLALEMRIAADKSLQLEWESLNRFALLKPETAPSFPKERILQPTIWNVEQPDTVFVQMMQLLDNELTDEAKAELEKKIALDKLLEVEWASLQQARLPVEAVIFEDKASLYRENENRKIAPWFRWAAAAAIIIGLGLYLLPKVSEVVQHNKTPELVKKVVPAPTKALKHGADSLNKAGTIEQETRAADLALEHKAEGTKKNNAINQDTGAAIASVALSRKNKQVRNKQQRNESSIGGDKDDEVESQELTQTTARNIVSDRTLITGKPDDGLSLKRTLPKQLNSVSIKKESSIITTASFVTNEPDLNASDDDIVYVAGARINKQKVRGIFRGITRSLERSFTKSKVEPDQAPILSRSL